MTGKLKVIFFGKFAELAETHLHSKSVLVPCESPCTPNEVIQKIAEPFPDMLNQLQQKNTLFAINHDMAKGSSQLQAGDELAIMPPISGG